MDNGCCQNCGSDDLVFMGRGENCAPDLLFYCCQVCGASCSEVADDEESEPDFDDSMDGDFDSGMASAGFGMDEDYNHWEMD